MVSITEVEYPRFEIEFGGKNKNRDNEIIEVVEFIGVKSYKAKGKRLTSFMVENIHEIEPVIRKESNSVVAPDDDEEEPKQASHEDPSQMKLEL